MGRAEVAPVSGKEARSPRTSQTQLTFIVVVMFVGGSLTSVWWISPPALLTSVLDAVAASVILAPATLFGYTLLRLFNFHPLQPRWTYIYSAALGLGSLSILALLAGLVGLLNRNLWLSVLAFMALAGVLSLRRSPVPAEARAVEVGTIANRAHFGWQFLWLIAAPFFTLALLAASNPPGMIWQEEGNGYDVLEYHLQLPKEYLQNERVGYLPHNVYANFPANLEMLYLLAMVVHDDVQDIGTTANMIHLAFAVLTVFAAWAIGRDISPQVGIMSGLAIATCTWLEYLSGLAYVENGMLFFGLCAVAATLKGFQRGEALSRWAVIAGLAAGFGAGCKYTAIPMIVMPIALVWLFERTTWRCRFLNFTTFCTFALLAVSPWLVKNWYYTGNPVFPLANESFTIWAPDWSADQTAQWNQAHFPSVKVETSNRLASFWEGVPADHEQRFGLAILGLPLLGLVARPRNRIDAALIAILLIQLSVWLFATHLYSRFAIPMILPLAVLFARAIPCGATPHRIWLIVAALIVGAGWNFAFAARRHARESAPGAPASLFYDGKLLGFEYIDVVNQLPSGSRLLLVADARPFYLTKSLDYYVAFNRNPFVEHVHGIHDPKGIIEWLRSKKYTHLLMHWGEVRRISSTYGFSPPIQYNELELAFAELMESELRLVRSFPHPTGSGVRYVDIYEVPRFQD